MRNEVQVDRSRFKREPTLAVGCSNGELFVFNLNRNVVTKRLTLHTHPIIGIEWSSIHCLITWAFASGGGSLSAMDLNSLSNSLQSPSTSSMSSSKQQVIQLVKNEILFTDIRTGKLTTSKP